MALFQEEDHLATGMRRLRELPALAHHRGPAGRWLGGQFVATQGGRAADGCCGRRRHRVQAAPVASGLTLLAEATAEPAIRRGVFHSVADLTEAIQEYLDAYNDEPKPFVWTASVNDILTKVGRGKAILATLH